MVDPELRQVNPVYCLHRLLGRWGLTMDGEPPTACLRAVALNHTDLTDFVLRHALLAAKAVIEEADHVQLSERDRRAGGYCVAARSSPQDRLQAVG